MDTEELTWSVGPRSRCLAQACPPAEGGPSGCRSHRGCANPGSGVSHWGDNPVVVICRRLQATLNKLLKCDARRSIARAFVVSGACMMMVHVAAMMMMYMTGPSAGDAGNRRRVR